AVKALSGLQLGRRHPTLRHTHARAGSPLRASVQGPVEIARPACKESSLHTGEVGGARSTRFAPAAQTPEILHFSATCRIVPALEGLGRHAVPRSTAKRSDRRVAAKVTIRYQGRSGGSIPSTSHDSGSPAGRLVQEQGALPTPSPFLALDGLLEATSSPR